MKLLKFFLAFFALSVAAHACARTASGPRKIVIVDGLFFDEVPVASHCVVKMYFLKTPSNTSAVGIELSGPLPEAALRHAVPPERIPESELLLQCFDQAKAAGTGIAVSFVKKPLLKAGERFPDFSATDIDGRRWTGADVRGKVMVLNLWFTGCGPCRAEMPELSAWKDEMPDVMFFSSTYEDAERARPVLESRKFDWIALVGDRQFTEFVGSNGYPVTIVVDRDGTVAQVEYGTSPVQRDELKATIRSLRAPTE